MATLQINCPECAKEIKAPEEAVGKKIRCKGCEHVFVVAKPKAAPAKSGKASAEKAGKAAPSKKEAKPAKEEAKPAKKADDDEEGPTNYGLRELDESYRCPDCANEMEGPDAVVCLHCGYNTQTRVKARKRKVKEITGGDQFSWTLPGILAVLYIICSIGYCFIHHYVLPPMMINKWDELYAKEGNTRFDVIEQTSDNLWMEYLFHPAIELWMAIMVLGSCFFAAKFAIRRLFIDNKPPEIEVK